ncbi:MAG: DEAD/DEAH box helicase [Alphaproteobacteria bacterium]|jgi:ATP-dependent RNA helicase DeaD|nr:DEAD/DEAH box helicase [Alphaproteobacteria bacterium]MBT7944322.1 DEAD/DEAH box helicase [Alphaproteobacteria bacterium]
MPQYARDYAPITPVQLAVLAPELQDADALVSAQTGSGKTVAFGMAIAPTLLGSAERFEHVRAPLALVVAPTRELAMQVKRELEWLYEVTGARVASCVGGMDMRDERRALKRGAHLVVGTPGRLRDHIERGSFDTSGLKAVVLDEADEMLDLGFREDLEYILDAAPRDRRTLLFSATVPHSIATLAKRFQRNAVRIATTSGEKQHVDIEYRALSVAPNDRENAIINVLRYFDAKNALVFCATRATVNHMTSRFTNRGFSVVALSGELSQNERTHALQAMRDGRARVCIATDVAARGIDLPNLELVIHADIPRNRETLLHRSGRTGRAGRKGVCALIVPHNWRTRTERLLSSAGVKATWAKPPSVDEIKLRDHERILTDPTLTAPLSENEQTFAKELLAQHSAEQVAAAFLRQHFAGQAAPEELLDAAPRDRKSSGRDDFRDGVWFSLTVGRKQNAEPRWLLPMLCRAGHVTKNDVGAIRILQNESFVELRPDCVERFLEAIGPSLKMEKTISVTRLEGRPEVPKESRDKGHKSYGKKKDYNAPTPGARGKPKSKRKFDKKPREQAADGKPWEKPAKNSKGKKPYKTKTAKTGAYKGGKNTRAEEPGSAPRMRKKK